MRRPALVLGAAALFGCAGSRPAPAATAADAAPKPGYYAVLKTARGEVELRGNADSTQAILEYAKELEQIEDVALVELKRSSRRTGPSGDRADFELLVRVREGQG